VKLGDNLIGIAVLLPFAIVVAFPIAMIFCDYLFKYISFNCRSFHV